MSPVRSLFLAFAVLVVCACGGGGGDAVTGGGGGGGTITETSKLAFVDKMRAQMTSWNSLPRTQRFSNLVAWAKAQPEVADASIEPSTQNVWILYKDGDATFWINNRAPKPTPVGPPPIRALKNDLPGATKATVIWSLEEGFFEDVTDGIRLDLNNYFYSATRLVNPTIPQLLAATNGAGVLFWQTHSGIVSDTRNGVRSTRFVVSTGEAPSVEKGQGIYKTYRDNRELFVGAVELDLGDGTKQQSAFYAINDLFIARHMKLAENALVAMDSCTGAASTLRDGFFAAGAGAHISWDTLSGYSSGERFSQMFDRLLGANTEPPLSTPLERPFDMDSVQFWMQDKQYDRDASPNSLAQLKFAYKAGSKTIMLRPTIARVIFEARDNQFNFTKFLIEGTFGPDPGAAGRVEWGGTPCQIISWDEQLGIRIRPPKPYPVGDIQVFRGTRPSNRVPLTEWTLPVTYTLNGRGTLQYKITMNLKFRVDARGARWTPEQPIQRHPVMIFQLDDSTGQVSASGQYKPSQDTTISWSGGTALTSKDIELIANGIIFGGDMNIVSGKIENVIIQTSGTYTRTVARTGSAPIVTQEGAVLDGYFTFNIPFNTTTYVIPSGSTPTTQPIGNPEGISASLTWTSATPPNPPTESTARQPGR